MIRYMYDGRFLSTKYNALAVGSWSVTNSKSVYYIHLQPYNNSNAQECMFVDSEFIIIEFTSTELEELKLFRHMR